MRRYWISPKPTGSVFEISGDTFHHIFDVCRQDKGSTFEVLFGDQKAHLVQVLEVAKKFARVETLSTRDIPALAKPHLHLVLSIPRYPVFESILEKAVEMGVHTVHLAYSDHSFIRSGLPAAKFDRWQKIIVSATQQSGRGELMQLPPPVSLTEILLRFNQKPSRMGLFAYEGKSEVSLRQEMQRKTAATEEVWVFIGAEGGFSQTEVQQFQKNSFNSVTLGEQVLRVETACIALLAVLKYEFDLMR